MYPAGEAGVSVRSVPFRDGVSLRVLESGAPSSTAVVLVHGWAGSVYSFAETIPALTGAGHRVVAIDLPGHGLSDKPRDRVWYSVPAMADAVAAVIAACGINRYALIAHSMSGAIALELSARTFNRPTRVVFVGAVGVGRVALAWVARFLTPRFVVGMIPPLLGRPLARVICGLAFGVNDRPTERDVEEYWAPTQFDGFAHALVACLHRANWHRESRAELGAFKVPTLVIAGGRDRVVQGVAHGGRYIPGARVVEVPEAGHLVMQECSAKVNPELVSFLK
jgi:3-oxoadipate enol-lactonase